MIGQTWLLPALPKLSSRHFLLDQMPKKSVCAEVGVHKGDFSQLILKIVKPIELHLIDPWKYETEEKYSRSWYGGATGGSQKLLDDRYQGVTKRFHKQIQAGTVTVHRLGSIEAVRQFADRSLDWVYIDGNHLYPFVLDDLTNWAQKVKPGGFITGDDYGEVGWWEDGVTRAVDDFVKDHSQKLELKTRNGQFILKIPA